MKNGSTMNLKKNPTFSTIIIIAVTLIAIDAMRNVQITNKQRRRQSINTTTNRAAINALLL